MEEATNTDGNHQSPTGNLQKKSSTKSSSSKSPKSRKSSSSSSKSPNSKSRKSSSQSPKSRKSSTSKSPRSKTKKSKSPRNEGPDVQDSDGNGAIEMKKMNGIGSGNNGGETSSMPRPPSPPLHSKSEHDQIEEVSIKKKNSDDYLDNLDDLPVADASPEGIHNSTGLVVVTATNVIPLTTDPVTGRTTITKSDQSNIRNDISNNDIGVGQRPSLISVRFFKETKDSSLGLTFRSVDGVLRINTILPNKPLTTSSLRQADEVIAIDNHRHCSRWTAVQAVNYVRNRHSGYLSLLIRNPFGDPNLHEAIVYKSDPNSRLGIIFKNDTSGRLRIERLNPSGVIGQMSALTVGDYVESISGNTCTHVDADVAREMTDGIQVSIVAKHTDSTEISLREFELQRRLSTNTSLALGEGVVAAESLEPVDLGVSVANVSSAAGTPIMDVGTLEYLEQEGIRPRFIYIKCFKPTVETPLGITFAENNGFGLKIDQIDTTGILGSSPLKEGFDVLAIDGRVCTSWTKSAATTYLDSRYTDITIVARNFSGTPSYVVAQAPKPSPRSKAGLTFRSYANRPLQIGVVSPTGIFAGSILNEKDDVLSINGVPARNLSTSEACAIIEHATDTVTVVARTNSNTGIVLAKLGPGESHVTIPSTRLEDEERRGAMNGRIVSVICCAIVLFFIIVIITGPDDGNF